jgi:hypothetical protein
VEVASLGVVEAEQRRQTLRAARPSQRRAISPAEMVGGKAQPEASCFTGSKVAQRAAEVSLDDVSLESAGAGVR